MTGTDQVEVIWAGLSLPVLSQAEEESKGPEYEPGCLNTVRLVCDCWDARGLSDHKSDRTRLPSPAKETSLRSSYHPTIALLRARCISHHASVLISALK